MTHGPVIKTPVREQFSERGLGVVKMEMEVVKPQREPKGMQVRMNSRPVVGAINARGPCRTNGSVMGAWKETIFIFFR